MDRRTQTIAVMDFRVEWKSARKKKRRPHGERKRKDCVTRLFVCETIVSIALPQFSSGCWQARRHLPIAQSAGALQQDNASCHDRGTGRRCAPRCRLESAVLPWKQESSHTLCASPFSSCHAAGCTPP